MHAARKKMLTAEDAGMSQREGKKRDERDKRDKKVELSGACVEFSDFLIRILKL